MRQVVFAFLALAAILVSSNQLCFAQTASLVRKDSVEKIKKKVEKIGVGKKITIYKLDKKIFYGKISKLEADGFEIVEADTNQVLEFKYADLKEVIKGDGERNLITGKRVHPRRGWLYGLGLVGGVIAILLVLLSDDDF